MRFRNLVLMRIFDGYGLRYPLLEEQFDTLDAGIAMQAPDHHVVHQVIVESQEDHALMVRHIRLHHRIRLPRWETCRRVIDCLVKTETTEHLQVLEMLDIAQDRLRL